MDFQSNSWKERDHWSWEPSRNSNSKEHTIYHSDDITRVYRDYWLVSTYWEGCCLPHIRSSPPLSNFNQLSSLYLSLSMLARGQVCTREISLSQKLSWPDPSNVPVQIDGQTTKGRIPYEIFFHAMDGRTIYLPLDRFISSSSQIFRLWLCESHWLSAGRKSSCAAAPHLSVSSDSSSVVLPENDHLEPTGKFFFF